MYEFPGVYPEVYGNAKNDLKQFAVSNETARYCKKLGGNAGNAHSLFL